MKSPPASTLLIGSVALNLFLAGALGVFLYRQAQKAPPVTPTLVAATQGLTPAHQVAFRDLLQAEGMRLKPMMHDAKISRRRAAELFSQPQVDTAAVLAALKQARTSEEDARGELEEKVVAFAAPLSAEERKSLSVILRRGEKTTRRTPGGAGGPTAVGKRNAAKP